MKLLCVVLDCIQANPLVTTVAGGCAVSLIVFAANRIYRIYYKKPEFDHPNTIASSVGGGAAINQSSLVHQNVHNVNYGTQTIIGEDDVSRDQEHLRHVIHALKEQKEKWPKRKEALNWDPQAESRRVLQEHVPSLGSTIPQDLRDGLHDYLAHDPPTLVARLRILDQLIADCEREER